MAGFLKGRNGLEGQRVARERPSTVRASRECGRAVWVMAVVVGVEVMAVDAASLGVGAIIASVKISSVAGVAASEVRLISAAATVAAVSAIGCSAVRVVVVEVTALSTDGMSSVIAVTSAAAAIGSSTKSVGDSACNCCDGETVIIGCGAGNLPGDFSFASFSASTSAMRAALASALVKGSLTPVTRAE